MLLQKRRRRRRRRKKVADNEWKKIDQELKRETDQNRVVMRS